MDKWVCNKCGLARPAIGVSQEISPEKCERPGCDGKYELKELTSPGADYWELWKKKRKKEDK